MNTPRSTVTIRDVARLAGVGIGTVSRVLNGGNQVSQSAHDRVMGAIRSLDFRPNAQARHFPRGRSDTVCFLLSNRDFPSSFHARILQGVEDCARMLGQHVLFAAIQYEPAIGPEYIQLPPMLEERGLFDGLILSGTNHPNFLTRIRKMQIPLVVLGNNVVDFKGVSHFDQVGYDGFQGALEAVRYVIGQGHRHIVFVGDITYPWVRVRHGAFLSACEEAGRKPTAITIPKPVGDVEYGEWACGRVLNLKPRPTAIVAANDEVAFGLWRSIRREGLQVPDKISLVGFDDREEAVLMDPPLTTVRVMKEKIGQTCMKTLMERILHPEKAFFNRVVPTELIIRKTVRQL